MLDADVSLPVATIAGTYRSLPFCDFQCVEELHSVLSEVWVKTVLVDSLRGWSRIASFGGNCQARKICPSWALSVSETIEKEVEFLPFTFDRRKVFLSAKLNDTSANLWFDSGSSSFELIVDEDTFLELAKPGAERESFLLNSLGSQIPGHNIESNGLFELGSTTAPLTYITNFEWPNKLMVGTIKAFSIGGDLGVMTGNKLFLNKTFVPDTPNLRNDVLPCYPYGCY